jgi:thiamine-phosphate diphosphorylase / hydroxyethylthiazole kinase
VFDPVGVGASRHRQAAAKGSFPVIISISYTDVHIELLNTWQATVIKGNAAEIGHFAGSNEVCSLLSRPLNFFLTVAR